MAATVQDSNLLTVQETAALLRQSERSIRRKIHAGQIPAVRLGDYGPLRIDRRGLEQWLYGESPAGAFPPLYPAVEDPTVRVDPPSGIVDSTQPVGKEGSRA
jgi:excisionase family DNA binding protein